MSQQIKRVLIVDDELTIVQSIHRHLRRKGFEIENAGNGKEAADYIRLSAQQGTPVDLVITDIVMPKMDGIQLLKWIQETYPEIHVIILTGFGESDIANEAIRPGIDRFGAKPITPEAMMELIASIKPQTRHRSSEPI